MEVAPQATLSQHNGPTIPHVDPRLSSGHGPLWGHLGLRSFYTTKCTLAYPFEIKIPLIEIGGHYRETMGGSIS